MLVGVLRLSLPLGRVKIILMAWHVNKTPSFVRHPAPGSINLIPEFYLGGSSLGIRAFPQFCNWVWSHAVNEQILLRSGGLLLTLAD